MKFNVLPKKIELLIGATLLMLVGCTGIRPPATPNVGETQTIPYSDSRITRLGRWTDTGTGVFSGWSSSQLIFTVRGTNFVNVICDIRDTNSTDYSLIAYSIDNDPANLSSITLSEKDQIISGTKSGTIPMPNLGTHTVTVQIMGAYTSQYENTSRISVKAIQLSVPGTLSTWTQGTVNLQTIGDSWTAAYNGMTRLLDRAYFKIYSVATPGITMAAMRPQYAFDYYTSLNTSDPVMAGIVIMYSVNEYNGDVTTEQFKTNMLALIDLVRFKQPTAKIILVRTPSNTAANKLYGQYGAVMSEISGIRANTFYFDTSSFDEELVGKWHDEWHLNAEGKVLLMSALEKYLKTTVGL